MKPLARLATTATLVLAYGTATAAQAEECSGDWPNPGHCFPDVLCQQYSDYWDLRRSVVHLYGPDIGGTGVLINNINCHTDGTACGMPYLLTANHVVSGYLGKEMTFGQKVAIETETSFTFGLEAAGCGGPTAGGAVGLIGAIVVAQSPKTDLLLLRLTTSLPPELGAYFAGWCGGPVDQAVSISHACGAPKRIAISEFGETVFVQTVNRDVYDVYWWEVGALARGSSGAPLFEVQAGALKGIFTNSVQAGSEACSFPSDIPAQDRFTALSSILEFLPKAVDGGASCIDHFDSNEGAPVVATVESSSYYGPGEVKQISATEKVLLVHGFFGDFGSTITITIQP
jgi:hypothetical protein